ncbi:unnamed protein product [marine sediment metagenome]|uniref:Uncharacterized protein n=1 Tax=marine sediment metagenome TaxID=412755 RepID=X1LLI0_9ZZZZ
MQTNAFDYVTISVALEGNHTHSTTSDVEIPAHSTAIPTDIDHAHTIDNADQKPPYYELAFLQAAAGAEIVDGIIIIWTDTIDSPNTIPAGWILQAGILDKYTRGCNGGYATAGSANHLHTVQPSATHNHGASISSTGTNHAHSAGYNTMPSHDHHITRAACNLGIRVEKATAGGSVYKTNNTCTEAGSESWVPQASWSCPPTSPEV